MDNRRKKPVITGSGSSTPDGRKENRKQQQSSTPLSSSDKRKDPPSKTPSSSSITSPSPCKRLSSDFHRKCCANEADHDPQSCKALSDQKRRAGAESPSPSDTQTSGRRSQSVPRTALRPIPMTLSTIKRTEFNLERARDAANNSPMPVKSPYSSPYATAYTMTRRTAIATTTSSPGLRSAPGTPSAFSTVKTPVRSTAKIAKGIMSGSKPKTPPALTSRALTLPKSVVSASAEHLKDSPADAHHMVDGAGKSVAAVSYASTRLNVKTPVGNKELAASRPLRETDHVTVTQSGGKSNVNIKMRISMAIKKDGESVASEEEAAPDESRRSVSPRTRAKALLNYTPTEVKEYAIEKTAVSVAVRLRPFSTRELKNPDINRVVFLNKDRSCVNVNKHEFEFNHVLDSFDPDPIDDQTQVYEVVGKPLLDHCLEGYNACLFAYGQTGSGKTYSLTGEEDVMYYDKQGVIPRLIKDLFLEMHLDSIVSMTYIEIYNDQIFNLLGDTTSDLQQLTYKIRESTVFGPYIPNLPPVIVESADDLLSRWSMGNIKRQKAATSCNEHSSRSHAILQITVQQKYHDESAESLESRETDTDSQASDGDRLISKINLVDLAGSERVAQTQTTGERFKEGTAINKSLLTLGKVISDLSTMSEHRNKVHIPYRESTLTFLLKESLGGNSRTCMLATISPASNQIEETLSTLRYASKAQRIVNCVRINEDPKILRIRQLENEIQRLIQLLDQRGQPVKALPVASPSTTTNSSATTSSPSTAEANTSIETTSSKASAAVSSEPSNYETPMKTPKKTQKEAASKPGARKAEKNEPEEKQQEKKDKKKDADKKKDEKAAEESKRSHEKAKSKKVQSKDADQSVESAAAASSSDNKDSGKKTQKKKQSAPEAEESTFVSPAKRDKKNAGSSEKAAKKTKESGVDTDSSPTEAKKKKVEQLVIPAAAQSKLLHNIGEIFSLPVKEEKSSEHFQDASDSTNLTYVSAGDASSLLNRAVIGSSSDASDSTVQEASRHVNWRDTVSVRSYQVSMDSTTVESTSLSSTSLSSTSCSGKSSPKTSPKKPEAQSGWGTESGGWGTEPVHDPEPESSGWGGGSDSKSGGWGAEPVQDPEPRSSNWGGESKSESGGWGTESQSGGWGSSATRDTNEQENQEEEWKDESEPATDSGWGESTERSSNAAAKDEDSLGYDDLLVAEDTTGETLSWSTCCKDNGVSAGSKQQEDDGDGW